MPYYAPSVSFCLFVCFKVKDQRDGLLHDNTISFQTKSYTSISVLTSQQFSWLLCHSIIKVIYDFPGKNVQTDPSLAKGMQKVNFR